MQMMADPLNTELLRQQEVYCSHKSRGCRKVMALSELEVCNHNFVSKKKNIFFH